MGEQFFKLAVHFSLRRIHFLSVRASATARSSGRRRNFPRFLSSILCSFPPARAIFGESLDTLVCSGFSVPRHCCIFGILRMLLVFRDFSRLAVRKVQARLEGDLREPPIEQLSRLPPQIS